MVIDDLMPDYDASEFHEIRVDASADRTYQAILAADFANNSIVRVLLAIRALPARLFGVSSARSFSGKLTLESAKRFGFFTLAENPPTEIVIGLQGKFWTVSGGTECATREALNEPIAQRTARAIWNFSIQQTSESSCTLATETRVQCADAHSRRRFRVYWLFVRPGSGLIRRMMLRTIRDLAERAG